MQPPVPGGVLLHADHAAAADLGFAVLLGLAGLGSAVVLGLALAALVRRRSRSYLLVTLALATLFARTSVAALSLAGSVAPGPHHWAEHALDAVMAALVVAAVYDARRVRESAGGENADQSGDGDRADRERSARSRTVKGDGGRRPGSDADPGGRDADPERSDAPGKDDADSEWDDQSSGDEPRRGERPRGGER